MYGVKLFLNRKVFFAMLIVLAGWLIVRSKPEAPPAYAQGNAFNVVVDKPLAEVGDTLTYTITLTNLQTKILNAVRIDAFFDSRLDDIQLVAPVLDEPAFNGNRLTLNDVTLQPGESLVIHAQALVSARARPGDVISNTATLQAANLYTTNAIDTTILPNSPFQAEIQERSPFINIALMGLVLLSIASLIWVSLYLPRRRNKPAAR